MSTNKFTHFASSERSSQSEILQQYEKIILNKDLIIFLNGIASIVTVLNTNRQIVFINKLGLSASGYNNIHDVLGMRLGELFGCQYAFVTNGCGTSDHCQECGAVCSMLACSTKKESIEECTITNVKTKTTLNLRVHSTFTKVYDDDVIICSVADISDEKRHAIMERIFFHDILNTVNGISGVANILQNTPPEQHDIYTLHLNRLIELLGEEINSYRILTLAEKNEYKTSNRLVASLDFLNEVVERYHQLALLDEKVIKIADNSENVSFMVDRVLLSRVLVNMIKNAIEAEPAGATINAGVIRGGDGNIHFFVHNNYVMSDTERLQVFNRSYSTKGKDRGMGTYSMKLLTEKYLNGVVELESQPKLGTTFTVKLPI